ncbi:MAG TPA: hypothetical protein VGL61_26985 [Kofleriaceae bacterium]|jgi:hypothetical protein
MKWSLLATLVGCAGAETPVAPQTLLVAPAPELVERSDAAVSCGPGLEIVVPSALATIARTADSIVVASPRAVVVVARGRHDLGGDLRVVADALHLSPSDLAQPATIGRASFAIDARDERFLADVSIAGHAYQLAYHREGNCTAIGLEQQPATGDSVAVAIAGDMAAQPTNQAPPRLKPFESFVGLLGEILRVGCGFDQKC